MSYSEEYSDFSREEEQRLYELRTQTCGDDDNLEAVAELVRNPEFTPSEEGLIRLTEGERREFVLLTGKHRAFMAEAQFRMAMGAEQNAKLDTTWDDGLMTERLTKLARGVMFWGSLVATAGPGLVGRQLGMTPEFSHWNWITDKLILGALPVITPLGDSGNHLELLRQQCEERQAHIGLVVSALTLDEMDGFGMDVCTFAKPEHWRTTLSVEEFEQIQCPDFGANTDYQSVLKAVRRMNEVVSRGSTVYVHCKAGKGRSWMVLTCYLVTMAGIPFDIAVELIRRRRYQVSPAPAQVRFVHSFISEFFNGKPQQTASNAIIEEYFRSAELTQPMAKKKVESTREQVPEEDPFESLLEGASY